MIIVLIVEQRWMVQRMNEIICCRDCVSSDCTGCNMLVLYHALERNRFEALMNENRHLNIDTDIAPVRHGHWIYDHWLEFTCSCCGAKSHSEPYRGRENYCYNCGARMDGE